MSVLNAFKPKFSQKGFTNHKHVDSVGLIHMNGRVYDPITARFLSADPIIQSPSNLQSLNRYSYVMNNPLSFVDPSGYWSLRKSLKKKWLQVRAVIKVIATIAAGFACANGSPTACYAMLGLAESARNDFHNYNRKKKGLPPDRSSWDNVTIGVSVPFDHTSFGVDDFSDDTTVGSLSSGMLGGTFSDGTEPSVSGGVFGILPFIVSTVVRAVVPVVARATPALIRMVRSLNRVDRQSDKLDTAVDVGKNVEKGARNPKVAEAAERGRQMHKDHNYGPGFEKEVTLPSGKRADAVNWETREVVELKPNNPNAIRRGERQVEVYRQELEGSTGECWTCRVETYD